MDEEMVGSAAGAACNSANANDDNNKRKEPSDGIS
jgi:hypothetical protein